MTEHEIISALHGSDAEKKRVLTYLLFERRDHFIRKIANFLEVDPSQDGFEDAFLEAFYSFSNNIRAFNPQKSSMISSWARFTWQRFFTWRRSEGRRNKRQWKVAMSGASGVMHKSLSSDTPEDGMLMPVITAMTSQNISASADANLLAEEQAGILEALLGTLGASCQEALVLWSLKVPHKEMSRLLKIKNPADKVKSCQNRLRNWLAAHPTVTDYFRTS